ncbi:MAG TPA: MalY/PatB family protein [Candidatus Syntrophosphaera sp.]|jgi:cystathionine beta-lyase|nr:MalY/PatB family protein [Candidatus Cloacimonadota bacterium]HOR03004.1 MalY/PatB family protein [Candidatus Syntrophosphaera sp.]HOG31457.1 MalY/PatB family protein [Candidatus Cloacimonadota bacterium]HOU72745.1 MalY/PatB family protein [Candidatus Syntrophosphaera sp.]HQG93737.1 MalY/PatB family protein [Candidatus Syntrophosphaera sp.]
MSYDFDRITNRRGSGCFKYDGLNMIYGRDDLISLWVADMDFPVAPAIMEALQKRLDHGIFGYNLRLPVFYDTVLNWVEKQYGYKADGDWMLSTPGVMPAVSLAVTVLTEPGDGVLIQTPVYRPFHNAALDQGRVLLTSPLLLRDGRYEIDFDDLESKLKGAKLFILCSPHNPVGRLWSEAELRKMGQLCRQHGVTVISDEIHADLVFDGAKAVSIAALDDFADITICCMSAAKSFNLAGLATSVVLVKNPSLRQPLASAIEEYHLFMGNSFGIEATIAAYRDSEVWLQALLTYLEGNRAFLLDAFESELPQLKMLKPEACYLAWIDFRALGLSDKAIADLLVNKARLALDPGLKFGDEGAGFQRLNFGCPRSVLAEAVDRLKKAISEV